jgi:plastocyanin
MMKQMWSPMAFPLVRRRALGAVVCLVAVLAAACGSSGTSTYGAASTSASTSTSAGAYATAAPASPATEASAANITIASNSFGDPITVPPGTQISVTNNDSAEHSVTSDTAGKFDTHVGGNADASFTAPTEPGEYPFHCTYHPSMHGVLIVQ